jgi:hypothetical protein
MNRRKSIVIGAALWVVGAGASPTFAQTTWRNYSCGDGSQFIVGFFQYDKRAHMQIDGKAVTLDKRLWLSGSGRNVFVSTLVPLLGSHQPSPVRQHRVCTGHQRSRTGLVSWIAASWYQAPPTATSLARDEARSVTALAFS